MDIDDKEVIKMLKDAFNAFCDKCAVKWIINEYEAPEEQRAEMIARWQAIRERGLELVEGIEDAA